MHLTQPIGATGILLVWVCALTLPAVAQESPLEADGVTVQLTPIGSPAQVFVDVETRDKIIVRVTADCRFNYFVNGVRRGFAKYQPYQPNTAFRPVVRGIPFGTQFPKELRDILVANDILNPDYTPNEATAQRLGWKLIDPADVGLDSNGRPIATRRPSTTEAGR